MAGAPGVDELGSNVVFVGNIPYTASEEQLQEVFETVGPVSSFRSSASPPLVLRCEGAEGLVWPARAKPPLERLLEPSCGIPCLEAA